MYFISLMTLSENYQKAFVYTSLCNYAQNLICDLNKNNIPELSEMLSKDARSFSGSSNLCLVPLPSVGCVSELSLGIGAASLSDDDIFALTSNEESSSPAVLQ